MEHSDVQEILEELRAIRDVLESINSKTPNQ
ncbi:MAG: hypothetical protein JWN33_138 [Candidatus Saccharibacteria bacterium]|nr:hypothetical protein [Candidatus Saccharibacteria bacterium]